MGTHFESSYTDARDVLKRISGVHSKLMGRLEERVHRLCQTMNYITAY
jgi:hypothetical protein